MSGRWLVILAVAAVLCQPLSCRADGFQLSWALKHEPHVVLRLNDEQVSLVGRERKLVLTEAQLTKLRKHAKSVPDTLGVESLGEPDCSCCIGSVLWTATDQVTVWTDRLARDADGSRRFYEIRKKQGFYTADASGQIYAAGRPLTWEEFEKALKKKKDGQYVQLSLPPIQPSEFAIRVQSLKEKHHFFYRL
jgi:hypothetical protein